MIITYRGIIRNGKVELQGVALPEGVEVLVVAEANLTLQEQQERYGALSAEDWKAPFESYHILTSEGPVEVQADDLTDEALNALIHESRTG